MTLITSKDLNFMVFRYLHESGFSHSAFTLGYEAGINKSTIDGSMVPPGALITFVQRGLQYMEMEANLACQSDTEADEDFSLLQPMDLITKSVPELQELIKERKKNRTKDRNKDKERDKNKNKEKNKEFKMEHEKAHARAREKDRVEREKESERDRERVERDKERGKHQDNNRKEAIAARDGKGQEPMDILTTSALQSLEIPKSDVRILEGHTSEVCACAWNPSGSLLASASGDSTARIWRIPQSSLTSKSVSYGVVVLKHLKARTNEKSRDVTTLDWNAEGTLLATGSYDGHARLWSSTGELKTTLSKHKGPVFSLKWNKKGDLVLTGSCDKTAIVWDVKTEECRQQFDFHSGPILDVDWRSSHSFATSSTDHTIHVCKVGENRPLRTFSGHQGEVNCVKWDPTGLLLASCSDDNTVKIWSLKHGGCAHDFRDHSKEIYTLRWSPTGPGTKNPHQQLLLASASFDSTVKLWDMDAGKLLGSLNGHRAPVYSVAFSPNGEYLASGSLDKSINIWSLKEKRIVRTYNGNGGIFEVCWNKDGSKIAACFANGRVCVLDLRM